MDNTQLSSLYPHTEHVLRLSAAFGVDANTSICTESITDLVENVLLCFEATADNRRS